MPGGVIISAYRFKSITLSLLFCQNLTYYNTFDVKVDTWWCRVWGWLPQQFAEEVKEVNRRKVLSTWESSAVLLNTPTKLFFSSFSFCEKSCVFSSFLKTFTHSSHGCINCHRGQVNCPYSCSNFFCAGTGFSSKVTCFKRLSTGEIFLTSQRWAIIFGPRLHLSAPDFSTNLCSTETYLSFSSVKTAWGALSLSFTHSSFSIDR